MQPLCPSIDKERKYGIYTIFSYMINSKDTRKEKQRINNRKQRDLKQNVKGARDTEKMKGIQKGVKMC